MKQQEKVAAMRDSEYRMIMNGKDATPAERRRILGAKASKAEKGRDSAPIESKPFSILK